MGTESVLMILLPHLVEFFVVILTPMGFSVLNFVSKKLVENLTQVGLFISKGYSPEVNFFWSLSDVKNDW